jgi:hypothetical protein
MRKVLVLLVATAIGCPCSGQTGTIRPNQACAMGASTCINGHPYACGGGVWRPIGTVGLCTPDVGVCCVDRMTNVHACVTQDRCADPQVGPATTRDAE